jgi:hypothetical protein
MEASMRDVRQVCILLGLLASSGAFGAERIRLAQQVAPIPVAPTPLISSQTTTACLVSCDTQVMNCQNACVVAGPTTGVVNPAGNAPCNLNCTTQQLVCKQACNRPQP